LLRQESFHLPRRVEPLYGLRIDLVQQPSGGVADAEFKRKNPLIAILNR
jgi:hypothetical protein